MAQNEEKDQLHQRNRRASESDKGQGATASHNVNILEMLSRAHNEYNKVAIDVHFKHFRVHL